MSQADTEEGQALCDELGISVIPTVQFWKEGAKLWEHRGIVQLQQDLGEGALLSSGRKNRPWRQRWPPCQPWLLCQKINS
jgi:hypothetical protein